MSYTSIVLQWLDEPITDNEEMALAEYINEADRREQRTKQTYAESISEYRKAQMKRDLESVRRIISAYDSA